MSIKIPVCYSFDTPFLDEFKSDMYIPVGCGGYISDFIKKLDSDGADNISEYNKYVNEITMIYWAARNYQVLDDPDYIGFAHYRRYLKFNDADLNENTILCSFERQPFSIYTTYSTYHVKSDLDTFIFYYLNKFPELQKDFIAYCSQNISMKCNIFVTSRKLFFEYFKFIEPCIRICLDKMLPPNIDLDSRDVYQRRALGFILERMTGFWIYLQQKNKEITVKDVPLIQADIDSIYARP